MNGGGNVFPISVVIPTYNRLNTLMRAVASVGRQTFLPREIIIVDDGSQDPTPKWLDKWLTLQEGFKKVVIVQEHGGVSQARNAGLQKATSPWIAFLDSDDEWLPHKLAAQVDYIASHPNIKVLHTEEIWIRRGVRVNARKKHKKRGGYIYQHCLPRCCLSPSSIVIHTEVFNKVGVFDETLPVCEDYDLWLRIAATFEIGYLGEPCIVKYGGHPDQLSRQYVGMDRYRVQALVKILEGGGLLAKEQRATIEMLRQKCHILIQGAEKRGNENWAHTYRQLLNRYPQK